METDKERLVRVTRAVFRGNGEGVSEADAKFLLSEAKIERRPPPTSDELLALIAKTEADSDAAFEKNPYGVLSHMVALERDVFKAMAAHARRSIEAEAAEGEEDAALAAFYSADDALDDDTRAGGFRLEIRAALAAAALYRAAHSPLVVISPDTRGEAIVAAFRAWDAHAHSPRVDGEPASDRAYRGFGLVVDAVLSVIPAVRPAAVVITGETVAALVDRFLAWPLPITVRSDQCAVDPAPEHARLRSGTNLLTADEARQMIEHLLVVLRPPPVEITDDMVATAAKEFSGAPFPSQRSLNKARAALAAAINPQEPTP